MKLNHGAYILARYSTDHQNPDTIEVQVDRCTEWCKQHELPVLDVFADYATSGMKLSRTGYDRMMSLLELGGADTVVIYDQSRMFRSMTGWFTFRDELARLGVRVVSVTQPQIGGDLRDPSIFIAEGAMALVNQMWVLQTRQKVIEKMRFMARNGLHTGGKPALGYHVVDGKLAIEPHEAAIVREIFDRYDAGSSYREIIEALNCKGYRTRTGKPFGTNSLHDLLKNEKYIGTLTFGRVPRTVSGHRNTHGDEDMSVIRIEDAIPAIIDKDQFARIQVKMTANKKAQAGRPAQRRDYPLRGRVFCGECGSAMTVGSSGKSQKYNYYDCSGKKRLHNGCENAPIRCEVLEQIVCEIVRGQIGVPESRAALLELMRSSRDKLHSDTAAAFAAAQARYNDVTRQLDSGTDAILSGLDSPALRTKIRTLEEEHARLDLTMRQLHQDAVHADLTDQQLTDSLDQLLRTAGADTSALLSIVARVEVTKDEIRVWTILDYNPDGTLKNARNHPIQSPSAPPDSSQNSTLRVSGTTFFANPLRWPCVQLFSIVSRNSKNGGP